MMGESFDMLNKLPDEVPELQPYQDKIYYIELDEESRKHVYVYTLNSGVFRFKNSLSYWVDYFNRRDCQFFKVYRSQAINLKKLVGYGWDNATYGPWWVSLGGMHVSINKRSYNCLNKSEYRHLNKSVKLRKPTST